MNDDQRYALRAAAAAAEYAKKKARDEGRRALLLSQALNQNMSLDPKTQEQLKRLLEAETRRVSQENFDWKLGQTLAVIILGGLALVFLLFVFGSRYSAQTSTQHRRDQQIIASSPEPIVTPQPTPTAAEVRRAQPVRENAPAEPGGQPEVRRALPLDNIEVRRGQLVVPRAGMKKGGGP